MHCINVYLIRKSDLRLEKIHSIMENNVNDLKNLKYVELNEGILAFLEIPDYFYQDKLVAKVMTDYFGGGGNQAAQLYESKKLIYSKDSENDYSSNPINDVLKQLGVCAKNGMDEFDTIGLGKYRSNESFESKFSK